MKFKVLAAAAALAVATPGLALAQSSAPVQIDSTFIRPSFPVNAGITPGFAYVRFQNETNVPVTEVDFTLDAAGSPVENFKDDGHYTEGMPVEHRFNFLLGDAQHDQSIDVARVVFADGTTWTNGEQAVRRQSMSADQSAPTNP
jgi:hypothetical protein